MLYRVLLFYVVYWILIKIALHEFLLLRVSLYFYIIIKPPFLIFLRGKVLLLQDMNYI